jgi:hypothetical protein
MRMESLKFTELKREDQDIGMKRGDKYCNEPNHEFSQYLNGGVEFLSLYLLLYFNC